jgi:hypothetical protein
MILEIRQTFCGGWHGRYKISVRTNYKNGTVNVDCRCLFRSNATPINVVTIAQWGVTGNNVYADVFVKVSTYARMVIYQIEGSRIWTLVSSTEASDTTTTDKKSSTEVYSSISAAATELHNQAYTRTLDSYDSGISYMATYAGGIIQSSTPSLGVNTTWYNTGTRV